MSPKLCQSFVEHLNTEMVGKYVKINVIEGSGASIMRTNEPVLPLRSFLQSPLLRNEVG
jgi:hypothetical protein